jgi:hypothetical protein
LVDKENQNLSAPEKEFLEEQWKKCNVDAQRLQALMREVDGQPPIIATKHPGTRSCKPLICAACCLSKASTQGSDTYSTIPNPKKVNSLVHDDLNPGDRISLDQYVSSVPGHLAHTYGKEKKRDKLTGGTIFVDHVTGHVSISLSIAVFLSRLIMWKMASLLQRHSRPTVTTKAKNWSSDALVPTIRME